MSQFPKISIITPSLNQGEFIEETILSVLNQNYPNLQFIIIDGGSTDKTIEIIKKYESSIDYWISEKDNGQSSAINKGLKKADGEIIAWLNSDDIYYENTLNKVAEYFKKNPECVCLIGKLRFIKERNPVRLSTPIVLETLEKTAGFINLSQPAMFFSRNTFDELGNLNENLHYCFDTVFWLKILLTNSFKNIIETTDLFSGFRLHKSSKSVTSSVNFVTEKDYIYYFLAKQFNLLKIAKTILQLENIPEPSHSLQIIYKKVDAHLAERVLNYYLFYRADQYYYNNNKPKASKCLKAIAPQFIDKLDKVSLLKLKFKNTYLPLSIIRWGRKLRM